MKDRHRGRWVVGTLVTLAVLAAGGLALSTWLFSTWTNVRTVEPPQAERAFAEALERSGGGTPYVEIAADGTVSVRRDQEGPQPLAVHALHLVALEPERRQLLEISFPFWFVRAKLTSTLNFGTLTTLLAGDWAHLDLEVTEEDLQRRGPGLILDHRLAGGGRVILWTE